MPGNEQYPGAKRRPGSKKGPTKGSGGQRRKGLEVTLWVDTVQKARDTVREQQRKIEIAGGRSRPLTPRPRAPARRSSI